MKILIGSDNIGYGLKEDIKEYLIGLGHEMIDLGCENAELSVDYPDVATSVAERIAEGGAERGILVCGTGIGMAIVANKVPHVRAACCHDPYSAERARKSNNAQILTMGAQIIAPTLAHIILDHWLISEFTGGRSAPKVAKIEQLDEKYRKGEYDEGVYQG
ncbi:MAG: ribose 5-phosphate isomerase B [Chloroflexi bacterium RBG_19FT_COMBO_56_12]|nr:MAG: ribose 5-phosphate isomerase B [Chloroflexi bacterium RBG_19FT_COMBO_56_12]